MIEPLIRGKTTLMNAQQAKQVALQRLSGLSVIEQEDLVILEQYTIEKPYGWIFYYQSKRYLQTHNSLDASCAGPMVVMKTDATIYHLGTPEDAWMEIKRFEATHFDPGQWPADQQTEYRSLRFFEAARSGNIAHLQSCLDIGIDIDEKELGLEHTALHSAVMAHRPNIVTFLLNAGADVNSRDHWGQTPLITAIRGNDEELVRLLLQKGARITEKDSEGKMAIDFAVRRKIIKMILVAHRVIGLFGR